MRNPSKTTAQILLAGLTLLVSFIALSVRADYSNTVAGLGPVGYWRLSEAVSPPGARVAVNLGTLGAKADGFPYTGTEITQAEPGVVGTCYRFTNIVGGGNNIGTGDFVGVPVLPELNPNGPFTVEFWAKPSDKTGVLLCPIGSLNNVGAGTPRNGYLVYLDLGADGGDHNWEFRIGGSASYAYNVKTANGTGPANVWTHVVCVYDGVLASVYINGQLSLGGPSANPQAKGAGKNFIPNISADFWIGGTQPFGRNFDGWLDEVAFYGTNLSANTIAAHYDAAKPSGGTNVAGYAAQVLASNPRGYWQFNEPVYTPPDPSTLPVTKNSGSLGALADGTNQPGMTAGVAGPPFAGFGGGNLGAHTVFQAGNVNVGDDAGLNFAGEITMMAWVKSDGVGGLRNILSHGYQSTPVNAEVELRIQNGEYNCGSWNGSGEGTNSSGGRAALDAGKWVMLTATYNSGDSSWRLYRYGTLIAGPSLGGPVLGALPMAAPWSIGSRGDTSGGDGRFLGGGVDEVAIWNRALTAVEIQSVFDAAQMSPVIIVPPVAPASTVFQGDNLSFSVEAAGAPTLQYQWTSNSVPISGATTTSLALNNATVSFSATYGVVVTNPYGSVTNSVAVTVVLSPPLITQQPKNANRYAGRSAAFSVTAIGPAPITYQWYYNTNTLIVGATLPNYTRNNVQPGDAGKYNCRLVNPGGNSNSAYATLTVLPAPTTSYPIAALADVPIAYYRLGESSGTVANDYWGGQDGTYNGVTLGQPGFSPLDPDTAAGFTGSGKYVGSINGIDFSGISSVFSLEAWVKGPASQVAGTDANATIIGKGHGGNGSGGLNGWQFVLDISGGKYRFLVEPASGAASTATADVGPDDTWQHVVGVYDQAAGAMAIYVNGLPSGAGGIPPATGPLATLIPVSIGAGQGGVSPVYDMYFVGTIDEVAIYDTALNPNQVHAHYCGQYGSSQAPIFAVQPSSVTEWVGWPITLSATVAGSCELAYQWNKGVTPLADGGTISGATSSRLSISALDPTNAGNYSLSVINGVGSSNSAVAVVTVLNTPTSDIPISGLVMHHKFDGNLIDSTGRGNNGTAVGGPTFEPGTNGSALHYTSYGVGATNKYVTLGVRPDLQFSSNVNFTVAYWVRLPLNSLSGDLPFLDSANGSYGGPGLTFAPSYKLGGWSYSLNGIAQLYGPNNTINDDTYHHLVHSFDRTGNGVTYLDGVQVDTRGINTVGNLDHGLGLNIGQDPTGTYPEAGEAWIDDLGVWRKALTAVEARGLYVAGTNGVSFTGTAGTFTMVKLPNRSLQFTWDPGVLQQADSVTGPYTDVVGATSPYTVAPAGTKKFYKLRF